MFTVRLKMWNLGPRPRTMTPSKKTFLAIINILYGNSFCYVNCLKWQLDSVLLWITGPHCFSVSNREGKDDKGSTWCTFPWYLQNSNSSYTGCHRDPSGSVHLLWSIPAQTWLFDCTHDPPVLKHPASVSGVQQKVAFPVKSESGSYIQADISRCCPYTK